MNVETVNHSPSTETVRHAFKSGDEVVLALGSHQGTLGTFVTLNKDPNWASITERDGQVRSHPMAWLALAAECPFPPVKTTA